MNRWTTQAVLMLAVGILLALTSTGVNADFTCFSIQTAGHGTRFLLTGCDKANVDEINRARGDSLPQCSTVTVFDINTFHNGAVDHLFVDTLSIQHFGTYKMGNFVDNIVSIGACQKKYAGYGTAVHAAKCVVIAVGGRVTDTGTFATVVGFPNLGSCTGAIVYFAALADSADDCPENACNNRGTCTDGGPCGLGIENCGLGAYNCECNPGFSGDDCEIATTTTTTTATTTTSTTNTTTTTSTNTSTSTTSNTNTTTTSTSTATSTSTTTLTTTVATTTTTTALCNGAGDPLSCSTDYSNKCADVVIGKLVKENCPVMCSTCVITNAAAQKPPTEGHASDVEGNGNANSATDKQSASNTIGKQANDYDVDDDGRLNANDTPSQEPAVDPSAAQPKKLGAGMIVFVILLCIFAIIGLWYLCFHHWCEGARNMLLKNSSSDSGGDRGDSSGEDAGETVDMMTNPMHAPPSAGQIANPMYAAHHTGNEKTGMQQVQPNRSRLLVDDGHGVSNSDANDHEAYENEDTHVPKHHVQSQSQPTGRIHAHESTDYGDIAGSAPAQSDGVGGGTSYISTESDGQLYAIPLEQNRMPTSAVTSIGSSSGYRSYAPLPTAHNGSNIDSYGPSITPPSSAEVTGVEADYYTEPVTEQQQQQQQQGVRTIVYAVSADNAGAGAVQNTTI